MNSIWLGLSVVMVYDLIVDMIRYLTKRNKALHEAPTGRTSFENHEAKVRDYINQNHSFSYYFKHRNVPARDALRVERQSKMKQYF